MLAPDGITVASEPAGNLPLTTRATPSDVGQAVVYLTTSRCLTGQIIYVDSGQHLL